MANESEKSEPKDKDCPVTEPIHAEMHALMEEVIFYDGFDDAIVGLTEMQPSRNQRLVTYDYDKLVRCCRQQGMTEDEAVEYLEFNTIGAWVGELTPIVVRVLRIER